MGCWNQACYVSKLPISWGEDIVAIMIKPNKFSEGHLCDCYATDNYIPFGYPIYGKYNDYGSIEEITNLEDVLEYFKTVELFTSDCGDSLRVEATKENIGDIIEDAFCGNLYVKEPSYKCEVFGESEPKRIEVLTVKRDLYDMLLNEVGNRTDYTKIKNVDVYKTKVEKAIKEMQHQIAYEKEVSEKDKHLALLEHQMTLSQFTSSYPCIIYWRSDNECIRTFIFKKLVDSFDEKQYNYLRDINFFCTVLMMLRMGFFSLSGMGSQSREMLIHKKVAEYIIKTTEKVVKDYYNDDSDKDVTAEEILSEPFSYWQKNENYPIG